MIKTTLPIVEKEIENDKLVATKKSIDVKIDTSIFAEERWESNFPQNASRETLFAYVERIKTDGLNDKAHILSNLKALYCFIEGDAIPDFKSFCQMFDIADGEYLNELTSKMRVVFDIALNGSAVTQKNL
ncbi:MAG TPA: hypothetical protein DEV87_06525 [Clostridiales bacterium]|nr:hypothetical protein [Clostridiales bacterium]